MFYRGNWIDSFPDNYQWSNATSITKGMAPYGAVALGEIDQVIQRLQGLLSIGPAGAEREGVVILGGLVHQCVHGQGDEVDVHDLRRWAQPRHRGPRRHPPRQEARRPLRGCPAQPPVSRDGGRLAARRLRALYQAGLRGVLCLDRQARDF